jgi:anti-sigma regulatory factor (Ser/Thr protein kinase)
MNEIPIASQRDAREIVRARLGERPAEIVETAVLLTDELVSNAIEHGAGRPRLVVEIDESQLHVEVHDDNPRVDLAPAVVEPLSPRGRGLAIVNGLAASWGVSPHGTGKAVWFCLDL